MPNSIMAAAPCGYPRRPTRVHRLQHGSGVTASGPVDEEARFATKKPMRTVGEVIVKSGLSVDCRSARRYCWLQ